MITVLSEQSKNQTEQFLKNPKIYCSSTILKTHLHLVRTTSLKVAPQGHELKKEAKDLGILN